MNKFVELRLSLRYIAVAMGKKKIPVLVNVNTRLFGEDIKAIKQVAAEQGLPWQIELRMLVRRAVKGEKREVFVLKERP